MVAEIQPPALASETEEASFYSELQANQLSAYWEVIPRLPPPKRWTHLWKWRDLEPLVRRSGTIVDPAHAVRRVLLLSSPDNPAGTTATLTASVQLVLPSEVAPVHRHTMTAIRFIISGHGAFTDVEGERIEMEPNDFVLTPSWNWHSHTNLTDEPVAWLDGLDSAIVRALRADLFEPGTEEEQRVTKPLNATRARMGNGFVRPANAEISTDLPVIYRWSDVRPELMRHANDKGSPADGVLLDYMNPSGGPSTLPTMHGRIQLLRPHEATETHRHMGSTIYKVVEGRGRSAVDETVHEWEEHDIFCVPAWSWHSHTNTRDQNAILFSYTDAPVLHALGLYREESLVQQPFD